MTGHDYYSPDRRDAATAARTNPPEEQHRAALYVCSRATDTADARLLLEALGLVDTGVRWQASIHTRHRKRVTDG